MQSSKLSWNPDKYGELKIDVALQCIVSVFYLRRARYTLESSNSEGCKSETFPIPLTGSKRIETTTIQCAKTAPRSNSS